MSKYTEAANLEVGKWYALVTDEYEGDTEVMALCRAPIAEYVGDGEFVDEYDTTFRAAGYDRFVAQS